MTNRSARRKSRSWWWTGRRRDCSSCAALAAPNVAQTGSPMPLRFEDPHPGGMNENSPAFQRWEPSRLAVSPEGTAAPAFIQPSLRDSTLTVPPPSVETLGYFHLSLRDKHTDPYEILVALDCQSAAQPINNQRCKISASLETFWTGPDGPSVCAAAYRFAGGGPRVGARAGPCHGSR